MLFELVFINPLIYLYAKTAKTNNGTGKMTLQQKYQREVLR